MPAPFDLSGLLPDAAPPFVNKIIQGDCRQLAAQLPEQSVDMIFADPPYNLQLRGELHRPDQSLVKGVDEDWDKFDNFAAYDQFTESWLTAMKRLLKPDGTMWVIGSYHNIFRLGTILQDLGFWLLNDVVWIKNNPMPNFKGRRFTNAHETLIWASRDKKARYQFHYQAMKTMNDDLQMRSDWYLPICSGNERIKTLTDDSQRARTTVSAHPTQKPESLLARVLLSSTQMGDLVLDPFSGSGTTLAVAKKLQRRYIGFEQEENYVTMANARLAAVRPLATTLLNTTTNRQQEKRIPFGQLLEAELIKVGEELINNDEQHRAQVMVDGSLQLVSKNNLGDGHDKTAAPQASIHRLAAMLEQQPSCNGWSYWYVKRGKKKILLDELRRTLRARLAEKLADNKNVAANKDMKKQKVINNKIKGTTTNPAIM